MIYKRLSRREMLKAIADHATFQSVDHSMSMKWDERAHAYFINGHGLTVMADLFEEFPSMSSMIRMSASFNVMGKELSTIIGTLTVHDWFVEILEPGEEADE